MSAAPGSEGYFASLKRLLATLLAAGHTRLELLATELEEEKLRLTTLVLHAQLAALLLGVGIVLLVATLATAFWESRVLVFGIFAALFIGGGIAVGALAAGRARRRDDPFAATLAALKEDIRQLEHERRQTD